MTPHEQLIQHDPKNGQYGDCFRTAIACLLDIEPESVPHFCENGGNAEDGAFKNADEWLRERHGLCLAAVPMVGEIEVKDALKHAGFWLRDCHYLLVGQSKTGCNHNVICKNGKVVHDPAPTKPGIIGPCDDSFYWINFLVSLK